MAKVSLNNGNLTRAAEPARPVEHPRRTEIPRQFLFEQHRISLGNIRAIITNLQRNLGKKRNFRGRMDDWDEAIRIIEEDMPEMLRITAPETITDRQQLETICREAKAMIQRAKRLMAMNTTKPLQRAFTEELDRVAQEINHRFALPATSTSQHENNGSDKHEVAADEASASEPNELVPAEDQDKELPEPPSFVSTLTDWGIEGEEAQREYAIVQLQKLMTKFYGDFLEVVASANSIFKFNEKLTEGQVQDFVQLARDCAADIRVAVEATSPDYSDLSEKLTAGISADMRTYRHLPELVLREFQTWVLEALCAQIQKQQDPEALVHMLVDQRENGPALITANSVREALIMEKLIEGEKLPLQPKEQELIRGQLGQVKARLRKKLYKDASAMTRIAATVNRQLHGGHVLRNAAFIAEAVRSLVAKAEAPSVEQERPPVSQATPIEAVVPEEPSASEAIELPAGLGEVPVEAEIPLAPVPESEEVEEIATPVRESIVPAVETAHTVPEEITETTDEAKHVTVVTTASQDVPQLLEDGIDIAVVRECLRMRELLLADILAQRDNLNPSEDVLAEIEGIQTEVALRFDEYTRKVDELDARFKAIGSGDLSVIATMRAEVREIRHNPEKLNDYSLDDLQELHARLTAYRQMLDETEKADRLHETLVDITTRLRASLRGIELKAAKAKSIRDTLGLLKGFKVDLAILFGDAITALQRQPEIEGRLQQMNLSVRELEQKCTTREQKRESTKGLSVFVNEALAATERTIEQMQRKAKEPVTTQYPAETHENPVTAEAPDVVADVSSPKWDVAWDQVTTFRIEGKEITLNALQFDFLRLLTTMGSPADPLVRRNKTFGATARRLGGFWTEVFVKGAGRDPVTTAVPSPDEISQLLEPISKEVPPHKERKQRKPPNKIMREKAQTLLLHYLDKRNRLNFLPTHLAYSFIADLPKPVQLTDDQRRILQIQFASGDPTRAANRRILEGYGINSDDIIAQQSTTRAQQKPNAGEEVEDESGAEDESE